MKIYRFKVQGSSEPYDITFSSEANTLKARCTCPAGENGLHCKHRIEIMRGKTSSILSGNENQVAEIVQLMKGTDLEKMFLQYEEAERTYDFAQKQFAKAKKALAKAMRG